MLAINPLLKLTLRQGTVYYMQHRYLTSPLPHFFIILNASPLTDKCLILAVASSQTEKVRARRENFPQETLVEVSPDEYDEFSSDTIIDCNAYLEITMTELQGKLKTKEVIAKKDIPMEILEQIIKGVKKSPAVEPCIKQLL